MTDGEVAAYLAGIDIGRNASVVTLNHGRIEVPYDLERTVEVPEACKGMDVDKFRNWLLRGVGDAFKG